ncbi:MAG: dihydroorotase [Bacteroidales bacterium]|nr:dihydroorotase [Bacteroidales bacterium]MBN2699757.1 dihydroorotase [Bacteroidales bacterium]
MNNYLIKNAAIINRGKTFYGFVLVRGGVIKVVSEGVPGVESDYAEVIDAKGQTLIPGVIDEHVHFREPGLTHKATIFTESRAAVAGGVTSYMEMPNTIPQVISIEELEKKYKRAAETSFANYSFYLGATNNNLEEIRNLDPSKNCGVKIFMGSSTGNMLVDDLNILEQIFKESPALLVAHCEDENTIQKNIQKYRKEFGELIPVYLHPEIRSSEACYKSSSLAVRLARKFGTRLHILHLSTAKETGLFQADNDFDRKHITAEACIHHLWFTDEHYNTKGMLLKWNPAVKTAHDRDSLMEALLNDQIDVVATDHAPHTIEEKQNNYFESPSGGPMIQHSLAAMMELAHQGRITPEKVVEKMCHAPARLFRIKSRGFIEPGFKADLALIDRNCEWKVGKQNLYYKCRWSPMEGQIFHSRVTHTWVNGCLVYKEGFFNEMVRGERLEFGWGE